jgi:double-strand break repair protein MRE11
MESTRDRAADLVLLGGDLFDSSVPSLKTIHQACEIFRNTVIGNDAIDFELQGMEPNFVQENINIGMPVFVIHGNHD